MLVLHGIWIGGNGVGVGAWNDQKTENVWNGNNDNLPTDVDVTEWRKKKKTVYSNHNQPHF